MSRAVAARPYGAASRTSQELANWETSIGSADTDYLPDRNSIVARTRDLVRNSGWASSAVSRHLDNVVGSGFRLSYKPDYKALGQSAEWALEFEKEIEGKWRLHAEDPDNWIDATRHDNFHGLMALAYRHDVIDGEALAIPLWLENKPAGRYATTIQMIDPDRLSNPSESWDEEYFRGGVEIDYFGAPIAYHIRKAHPFDYYAGAKTYEWERVETLSPWGRQQIIHTFDKERAGQTRGISLLTPIVERLKMLDKYDKTELQAAVVNAIFAAYIESPFDHEFMQDALDGGGLGKYQNERSAFHNEKKLSLQDGVRLPALFPGEQIKAISAARPASQFGAFETACLRNIASGVGLTYEQLSNDFSKTNYSSMRGGLLEVWRGLYRRRKRIGGQFATPVFSLWLEEGFGRGDFSIPKGAPDFWAAKPAWCRCNWIGDGRGWVDPVKEAQAAQMRMDMGISTLEAECAEQGRDWEETIEQRAREIKKFKELGLPVPQWAGSLVNGTVEEVETNAGENADAA